jgi:hypothetical protein
MGKGAAILGLILIIVGLLPILATFLTGIVDLSMILGYFDQGIYSIPLAGYVFTEVMLALIGIGVLLLIIGAVK